jgi:hypothetical protein
MTMGPAAGLLRSLSGVFVEPVVTTLEPDALRHAGTPPVVAVVGLRRGSGATTVARALAAELAARDGGRAALVTATGVGDSAIPLGTPAAVRLARTASRATNVRTRAVGRLALVECEQQGIEPALHGLAPLVLDVVDRERACEVAAGVDASVLVASPECQPALASVMEGSMTSGPPCVTVLNRDVEGDAAWEGRCDVRLPDSALAARLAHVGREAPNAFGHAIAALADGLPVTGA